LTLSITLISAFIVDDHLARSGATASA